MEQALRRQQRKSERFGPVAEMERGTGQGPDGGLWSQARPLACRQPGGTRGLRPPTLALARAPPPPPPPPAGASSGLPWGPPRTELLQADVLHGVDAGQVGDAALDARSLVSAGLLHALDHLLLAVDPVQVPAQHGQAHGLHHVGVLQRQAVGPCEADGALSSAHAWRGRTRAAGGLGRAPQDQVDTRPAPRRPCAPPGQAQSQKPKLRTPGAGLVNTEPPLPLARPACGRRAPQSISLLQPRGLLV